MSAKFFAMQQPLLVSTHSVMPTAFFFKVIVKEGKLLKMYIHRYVKV
ncbi:hypothetical protein [Silvanigrella aquatica]|nr:hypothetical protein [Silvanigrella aquatica]